MRVYFTNDQGQFVIPQWDVLEVKQLPAGPEFDALRALPVGSFKIDWRVRTGFKMMGFKRANSTFEPGALMLTQTQVEDYLFNDELIKSLKALKKSLGPNVMLQDFAHRYTKLRKELASGAVKMNVFDPLQDFAQAESVALFCTLKDGKEGFINKQGDLGSLATALTFQSEKHAQEAIRRQSMLRHYDQIQLVKLSVSVQGLGDRVSPPYIYGSRTDFSKSSIMDVNALAEKKYIEQALKMADFEQIKEAYEKLKEQLGLPPEEKPTSGRRKM